MEFRPQSIPGCHVVALEPIGDERGFFARAFAVDEFTRAGLEPTISQMNLSLSKEAGTTRGIHWQEEPFAEAKLVRCVRGRVFDVCVDLREGSETWGHWVGVELTPDNRLALYLPPGCGHGYQTLEPETELLYSTSTPYAPSYERGARWDDPSFGIDWPLKDNLVVSEKDRSWPRVELT
jgi:dTDP-4-dehydrorhamnose 3,5-epimerase